MLSVPWIFAGAITGLLIVSVFNPQVRQVPTVPTPSDVGFFHTKTGCINIQASEVHCSPNAVSLNILK
jgi:hypothetical protein